MSSGGREGWAESTRRLGEDPSVPQDILPGEAGDPGMGKEVLGTTTISEVSCSLMPLEVNPQLRPRWTVIREET